MTMQIHSPVQAAPPAAREYRTRGDRWTALCRRDRAADGRFVYAVKTTGVFCRPACASRRPRSENVEFFDTAALASRAGYRACKRCAPAGDALPDPTVQAIVDACRLLEGDRARRSDELADRVGLSRAHFTRAFKRHVGVTPQAYRRRVLAERARGSLADAHSVTAAAYAAGYSSPSRFYEGIGRELGMAPREARRGAEGKQVHYAVRACSLGFVVVAFTDRGVCEVGFADSERAAIAALRERFPRATPAPGANLPVFIENVVAAVERPQSADVPLDIQGTAFQQRVWTELRRIPPGQTRSYAEIARALGTGPRAVARACASNRLAALVPCHRVVRSDGGLAGYRWHPERKRKLLRREAKRR
jgi:AraC family transcriptional regulator of adaptative response/methylated-DNA-[protein]-cysteine methyltransferase